MPLYPAPSNILITGPIGVGKSTVLRNVLTYLDNRGVLYGTLFTQPVIQDGVRVGYTLIDSSGRLCTFASEQIVSPIRFSKYRIDVKAFDQFGVAVLQTMLENKDVLIIDEIGLMEQTARLFRAKVQQCLDSDKLFIAVYQMRAGWFSSHLGERRDMCCFVVTEKNRDRIIHSIINELDKILKCYNF